MTTQFLSCFGSAICWNIIEICTFPTTELALFLYSLCPLIHLPVFFAYFDFSSIPYNQQCAGQQPPVVSLPFSLPDDRFDLCELDYEWMPHHRLPAHSCPSSRCKCKRGNENPTFCWPPVFGCLTQLEGHYVIRRLVGMFHQCHPAGLLRDGSLAIGRCGSFFGRNSCFSAGICPRWGCTACIASKIKPKMDGQLAAWLVGSLSRRLIQNALVQ